MDFVFTAQETFKALMNAYSHPFRVYQIPEVDLGTHSTLKLLAYTLTDGSVSLYVHENNELFKEIKETNNVKYADINTANFVIIPDSDENDLISKVYCGDLIDPQKSATVIIVVSELEGQVKFTTKGPGIDGTFEYLASEAVANYLREASKLNIEYPMGFEMIFTTPSGSILAVPRHTSWEEN